jgi:hypothetical protein
MKAGMKAWMKAWMKAGKRDSLPPVNGSLVLLEPSNLVSSLLEKYQNARQRGFLNQYYALGERGGALFDSSAYSQSVASSLETSIASYQDSQFNELKNAIISISNRTAAACIAAALASAFLFHRKYSKAITLAEMAMASNMFDVFPQRLSIAVDEQVNNKAGELEAYLRASFCAVPFGHFETGADGAVYGCCSGWLPKSIGILEAEQSVEAIWRSDAALDIRASIVDGSFRYCSPKHCHLIASRRLQSKAAITDEQLARYQAQGPTEAVFSHDQSCNLSCPSCREHKIVVGKSQQAKYDILIRDVLIPIMQSCEDVKITGSGDPFGSIHFRNLLADYCAIHQCPRKINLHTNGVLFDERAWTSLKLEGNVKDVSVSVDATTEGTYKILRRGGDFARLIRNLEFLGTLRAENKFNYLALICVVQRLNYRELPDFVRMAKIVCADTALFWRIRNWGTYSMEEFLDHDVANPDHPEHPAFLKVLQDPLMDDPIVMLQDLTNLRKPASGEVEVADRVSYLLA